MSYPIKWRYIDKQSKHTWLVLPGWAMNSTIFNTLHLPGNIILIDQVDPRNYLNQIQKLLKNVSCFSILAYSLGAFQAVKLSQETEHIPQKMILCSAQSAYSTDSITLTKKAIIKNKSYFLSNFYKNCFYNNEDYLKFKKQFEDQFLNLFSEDYLIEHLDTLTKDPILNISDKIETKLIHGQEDRITPLISAKRLAKKLNLPLKTIPNCGHYLFFSNSAHLEIASFLT